MIHIVLGTDPSLNFYLDLNLELRFECINNQGAPDSTAMFEFYNSSRDLVARENTDSNRDSLSYSITEDFIIRCIVEGQHSEDYMFAGKVTMSY